MSPEHARRPGYKDTLESIPAFDDDHEIEKTMAVPATDLVANDDGSLANAPTRKEYRGVTDEDIRKEELKKGFDPDQRIGELKEKITDLEENNLYKRSKKLNIESKSGIVSRTETEVEHLRQEIADIDNRRLPDQIKDELIEILDNSPLETDGRVAILGNKNFLENIIKAGYIPGNAEANRRILAKEVSNQLSNIDTGLKGMFPGIKYDSTGEPIVGLWGRMTGKAKQIKNSELYQEFKAFFDFGNTIPGYVLNEKKVVTGASNTLKSAVALGALGLAGGAAYAASESKPVQPQRLSDETEEVAMPRRVEEAESKPNRTDIPIAVEDTARRADTVEDTSRSPKRGADTDQDTYTYSEREAGTNAVPKYDVGQESKPQPRSTKGAFDESKKPTRVQSDKTRMASRGAAQAQPSKTVPLFSAEELQGMEDARKMKETLRQGVGEVVTKTKKMFEEKTDTGMDEVGKTESKINLGGMTVHPEDEEETQGGDANDAVKASQKYMRETSKKTKAELDKDRLDWVGKAAPPRFNLRKNYGSLLKEIFGDQIEADLWIEKLGIAIEDALRLTPAEKREELLDAILASTDGSVKGSPMKRLAALAEDLRSDFLDGGLKKPADTIEKFQERLIE